jgi:protein disulfide-isomerase-like protein
MFKFLSNIPKAFKKMSNTQKAVVLAVIAAIVVVCYLYRQQISEFFVTLKNRITGTEHFEEEENEVVQQNEETFAIKGKGKQLVLFYAPWCPHCKTMMADWDKFAAENKSSVTAIKVNSDEQPDLVKEYSIQGFPTIVLLDASGKNIATYEGERTAQGFSEFVKAQ